MRKASRRESKTQRKVEGIRPACQRQGEKVGQEAWLMHKRATEDMKEFVNVWKTFTTTAVWLAAIDGSFVCNFPVPSANNIRRQSTVEPAAAAYFYTAYRNVHQKALLIERNRPQRRGHFNIADILDVDRLSGNPVALVYANAAHYPTIPSRNFFSIPFMSFSVASSAVRAIRFPVTSKQTGNLFTYASAAAFSVALQTDNCRTSQRGEPCPSSHLPTRPFTLRVVPASPEQHVHGLVFITSSAHFLSSHSRSADSTSLRFNASTEELLSV